MNDVAIDLTPYLNDDSIAWIDIETTGFTELDTDGVKRHKILEIGIILTNSNYEPYACHQVVIHHDKQDLLDLMDDYVLNMHTKNGLLADCEASTISEAQAEQQVLDFLGKNISNFTAPLAGNTIFLDRAFIEGRMPELSRYLHYRNFDVSALKIFFSKLSPKLEYQKDASHRAMDDIAMSLKEVQYYHRLAAPFLSQMLEMVENDGIDEG